MKEHCPNCSEQIVLFALPKFCHKCGVPLSEEARENTSSHGVSRDYSGSTSTSLPAGYDEVGGALAPPKLGSSFEEMFGQTFEEFTSKGVWRKDWNTQIAEPAIQEARRERRSGISKGVKIGLTALALFISVLAYMIWIKPPKPPVEPDNAIWEEARTLAHAGFTADAVAKYREVVRLNPLDRSAHQEFAFVLQQSGDLDGAIREWRQALGGVYTSPGSVDIMLRGDDFDEAHLRYDLGRALEREGRVDEAGKHYCVAHQKAPQSYFYYSECKRLVPNYND